MANERTEPLQLNLGSLRSAMSLTLHTHHASRIWHGRAPTEGRPGIIGLNGFIGAMNKMKRGAEQDDPYSDWWMLRIEDKLADTKTRLQTLREQVDQALADVPAALSLGENMNVQPVKLPLFVNAQLGFMAVYLLADYDDLARKLILAHHTALIDRSTLERWLNDGAHALRSLFFAYRANYQPHGWGKRGQRQSGCVNRTLRVRPRQDEPARPASSYPRRRIHHGNSSQRPER